MVLVVDLLDLLDGWDDEHFVADFVPVGTLKSHSDALFASDLHVFFVFFSLAPVVDDQPAASLPHKLFYSGDLGDLLLSAFGREQSHHEIFPVLLSLIVPAEHRIVIAVPALCH